MAGFAPVMMPLAQSDSKARFFQRLGLDMDDPDHKRIYILMKAGHSLMRGDCRAEAARSRERLMHSRNSLVSQLRHDYTVQPPFSSSQMSETAMHRETLFIYHNASPETRRYYELAHDTRGAAEENWIIRWMLWHVFRYRDGRNHRPSNTSSSSPNEESTPTSGPTGNHDDQGGGSVAPAGHQQCDTRAHYYNRRLPFDPARDC